MCETLPSSGCLYNFQPATKTFVEEKNIVDYVIPLLFYTATVVFALNHNSRQKISNSDGLEFPDVFILSKHLFLTTMHGIKIYVSEKYLTTASTVYPSKEEFVTEG